MQYKFDHYVLSSGNVLTVCSALDRQAMMYYIGYAVCNVSCDVYVKKVGNKVAMDRLMTYELVVDLHDWLNEDQLKHYYLAHVAVQAVIADIPRSQYGIEFSRDTVEDIGELLSYLEEEIERREYENDDVDDFGIYVARSYAGEDDLIIYDKCGRFVPVYQDDVDSLIQKLLEVVESDECVRVDPFNLPV